MSDKPFEDIYVDDEMNEFEDDEEAPVDNEASFVWQNRARSRNENKD